MGLVQASSIRGLAASSNRVAAGGWRTSSTLSRLLQGLFTGLVSKLWTVSGYGCYLKWFGASPVQLGDRVLGPVIWEPYHQVPNQGSIPWAHGFGG